MAKYEKVGGGTYGVYKKKKSGCAPIIVGVIIFFVVMGLLSECSGAEIAGNHLPVSHLEPVQDDPGVFRYVEGDGSAAVVTLSAEMSRKDGRFVILVASTPEHETQALAHGKKLAAWFVEKIDGVSAIPIVVYRNDQGVGYTYFISGHSYYHKEYAVGGVMTPQQTVESRDNAVLSYKARKVIREEGSRDSEWFN